MVQRLDKGTSGAMVVAKTAQAAADISAKFKERDITKSYLGFCQGIPKMGSQEGYTYTGTITTTLEYNPASRL